MKLSVSRAASDHSAWWRICHAVCFYSCRVSLVNIGESVETGSAQSSFWAKSYRAVRSAHQPNITLSLRGSYINIIGIHGVSECLLLSNDWTIGYYLVVQRHRQGLEFGRIAGIFFLLQMTMMFYKATYSFPLAKLQQPVLNAFHLHHLHIHS